jgi:hypothetical protein
VACMIYGLPFRSLHANVFIMGSGLELDLLRESRSDRDLRSIDIIIRAFWHLEMNAVMFPRIDIAVPVQDWMGL